MRYVLMLSFFLTFAIANAETDPVAWKKLGQSILKKEKYNRNIGAYVLRNIAPADPTKTHYSDSLLVTHVTRKPDGSTTPAFVMSVSEDWVNTADGKWDIQQWKDPADESGNLIAGSNMHIVETVDGTIVGGHYGPIADPKDPAQIARWNAILERWYKAQISKQTADVN